MLLLWVLGARFRDSFSEMVMQRKKHMHVASLFGPHVSFTAPPQLMVMRFHFR